MKTIINRFDLYRFERLVSKLVKQADLPATVSFALCSDGLQIVAHCNGAVLTLTAPSAGEVEPFTLSWATVKEFASKKNHYVDLIVSGKNVTLSWSVNGIPQTKSVQSLGLTDKRLPSKPDKTVAHSFRLLDALVDAAKCVDDENKRYSLGAICLRGANSEIISTDGKQALIQEGFDFPFDDDVLCPVSRIYGSKDLRELGETVKVGADGDYVYFNVANADIWLRKVEGRFPQLDQFTKDIDGYAWLHVDPTDAVFVSERINVLPGKDNHDDPVYVGLGNSVAVRGHDKLMQCATELRLTKSKYDGGNIVSSMNRHFLKNALDLGIHRIGFDPNDKKPLVGYGDKKVFILMPLGGDEPNVDADKLTVLMSDAKVSVPSKIEKSTKTEKPIPTAQACRNVKPQARSNAKPKGKAVVLDDAMRLRQNLRDTLGSVNSLIQAIKSQRRQDKLLRDTVASLRKLQNV